MTVNPNSLANLRPWKPGQSGNPKGPPRKKLVVEYLEEEIAEIAKTQGVESGTRLAAKKWAQMLFAGDRGAWKDYLDRRDGAVKQELGVRHDVSARLAELYRGCMLPEEEEEPPMLVEPSE